MNGAGQEGMRFRAWSPKDREACLALFDANCPEAFAPNERAEYEAFLDAAHGGYEVCEVEEEGRVVVAGAFGLLRDDARLSLRWILLDPAVQGRGLGGAMVRRAVELAGEAGADAIAIAASHRSAPFFVKFGACVLRETRDGWGRGMHRVDMSLPVGS